MAYHRQQRSETKAAFGSKGSKPFGAMYSSGKLTMDSLVSYRGTKTVVREVFEKDIEWMQWMNQRYPALFDLNIRNKIKASITPGLSDAAD